MVDEGGYCTDCDSSDCLHAQLHDALAQVEYWKRKATERKAEVRKLTPCVHDLESTKKTLKAIIGEENPGFYCTVCSARWTANFQYKSGRSQN